MLFPKSCGSYVLRKNEFEGVVFMLSGMNKAYGIYSPKDT